MMQEFGNLRAFARDMMRDGRLRIRIEAGALNFDGNAFQLLLWREGCWQLELITLMPNIVVPPHRHDNVETYDVYLGGVGTLQSSQDVDRQIARLSTGTLFGVSVPAGTPHGGSVGPHGISFLSFQRWNGAPRLIHEDWQPC